MTATATTTEQPARRPSARRRTSEAGSTTASARVAGWTEEELAAVRAELDAAGETLRRDIAAAEVAWQQMQRDAGEGAGDDSADAGAKTFEREHELSLTQNRRDLLLQVEHALDRLARGTYGACESCGQPIAKARLQAFPSATLCLPCKSRQERR